MCSQNAEKIVSESENELKQQFDKIDKIALYNQRKVLSAFRKNAIQARHLYGSTGYGYGDDGRDTLGRLFSSVFGAEKTLVSPLISSGTHALTLMLFGAMKAGQKLVAITGMPYDTLTDVILGEGNGSLKDFGVQFESIKVIVDDNGDPHFDYDNISKILNSEPISAVFIQRSRGYNWRQPLTVEQIGEAIKFVKKISPKTNVLVDNCYGEFTDTIEPTEVGADLMAGSLIKNPGGGIAPTGGYVSGRADLVERAAQRLTAPGVGSEIGSYINGYLPFYQGFFLAPSTVKCALKGSLLFSRAFEKIGFETLPKHGFDPHDIVTSVKFDTAEQLIAFCRSIQEISPIDSNVTLEPWDMPGYQDQVIMAAGTFVGGASIELSADSPIRAPYIAYIQGGLTYEHVRIAVEYALEKFVG